MDNQETVRDFIEDAIIQTDNKTSLSVEEVAKALGCTRANIYVLTKKGKLAYYRTGVRRGIRIPTDSLRQFLLREMR